MGAVVYNDFVSFKERYTGNYWFTEGRHNNSTNSATVETGIYGGKGQINVARNHSLLRHRRRGKSSPNRDRPMQLVGLKTQLHDNSFVNQN